MTTARGNRSGTISLRKLSVTTSTLALLAMAFAPSSAHAQDATFNGTDSTSGPFSYGMQTFNDSSTLNAAVADTLTGGDQFFNTNSILDASAANAVSGGLQHFKQNSVLIARATNAISGGQQDFDHNSVLNVNAVHAIGGGAQYFYGSTSLNLNVANAIGGGTQSLSQSATLNVRAADALTNSNSLVFNNTTGGGTGGFMLLNGFDTVIGRITSISFSPSTGGWIANGAATPVTLTVDSSVLGDSSFSGVIADGGGPLTLVKTGVGTLTLSGSTGYSGGTRIEGGTIRLSGGGSLGSQTGALFVGSDGVLDLGGTSPRVGGLSGTGLITSSVVVSGGNNLVIVNQTDTSFGGIIRDGAGGAKVGLFKIGAGTGTQTLTGANTYSGGTLLDGGTLRVAGAGTLGASTGSLSISNGATLVFDTAALTVGSLSGAGTITRSDFNPGVLTVDQASDTVFSGDIADYFDEINGVTTMTGLNKSGVGTLTLSGNNSYTGATDVTGGTLLVDGALGNVMWGAIQLGTSQVAVASGGRLGGAGSISGGVSVASGGTLLGRAGQTLSMGSLALNAGSVTDISLGGPSSTRLFNVAGDLTLAGTLNVSDAGGFGNGLYRLFDYGGTLTNNGMSVGATPTGYGAGDLTVQTSVANQVNLLVGAVAPSSYSFWDGANTAANNAVDGGAGTWSAGGINWTNAAGSANGVYDPAAVLIFMGAPGTVTADAAGGALDVSGGIQFFANGYTVTGDALNLTAPDVAMRVGDGSVGGAAITATIASRLTGTGGIDKTDLGTLTLTGISNFSGDIAVNGGALAIRNGGSVSNNAGEIAKDVGARGTLTVDGAGSTWTSNSGVFVGVGANSSGKLNITNGGGVLQIHGDGVVGAGASGVATVDGVGSKWVNSGATSAIFVGNSGGSGTLSVTNGGNVSDTFGAIGANAATSTVTVDGAGSSWTNTSNLNVGQFGNGTLTITNGGSVSSATAVIGNGNGANGTVTIGSAGSWTNTGSFVVGQGGSATLNLNGVAGARGVLQTQSISKGAGTAAINFDGGVLRASPGSFNVNLLDGLATGDVTIKAGGAFIDSNGGFVSIRSAMGGDGALTKQGDGTLYLFGTNSYAGGTIVDAGTLAIMDGGTLGAANGALEVASGATLDLGNSAQTVGALSGGGTITGNLEGLPSLAVNQSTNTTFFGVIADGFDTSAGGAVQVGLSMRGGGILRLSGVNTYTGETRIYGGGEIQVDGSIASAVTVDSAGALSGAGTVFNAVTLSHNGVLAGQSGQTLTMNSLTMNDGSVMVATLGAPSTAGFFKVQGDLTLNGTSLLDVSPDTGFGAGLYRVIDFGGNLTGGGSLAVDPAANPQWNLQVQTAAHQVNLLVGTSANPGAFAFWNGAQTTPNNAVNGGAGTWTATGTNWTNAGGSASGVYDPAAMLIFQGTPGTVTVDAGGGALDVGGGMQFFVDGYKVTGDALNLSASATPIRVGDGASAGAGMTATVSSVITGSGGINKTDLGTLILSGTNSYTGGTTISAGTLKFDVDLGGTLGAPTGALAIAGGGTFDLTGTNPTVGALSGAGSITSSVFGGRQSSLTVDQATDTSFSGAITDGYMTGTGNGTVWLIKDGAGTLALTGNSKFAYTTVNSGTLTIANGGTVKNETSYIGEANGSNGTILVTGNGSVWTTEYLNLGYRGAGTLTIADGGRVSLGAGTVDMVRTSSSSGTLNLNGTAGARGVLETNGVWKALDGATVNFDGGILRATTADSDLLGHFAAGDVTIKAGGAFIDSNGYQVEISAPLGGVGALTKQGAGELYVIGANTYQGGTNIEAGRLFIGDGGTLGATTGSLFIASGATLDLGITSQTVGSLSGAGIVTSTVTMGSPSRLIVDQAAETSFSGSIANGVYVASPGTGSLPAIIVPTVIGLTKSGAGTLTLSGTNTYTGDTDVTGGTLLVDGALADTRVAVASGAALGGAGAIAGDVSVANGGILLGRAGQTLSMGSLALDSGSIVNVSLGAPSDTRLFDVAGDLALNGTLNVANVGGFGDGLYRLFDYGGALSGAGLAIGAMPSGYAVGDLTVQTSVAHQVNLIASSGPYIFWDGANTIANGMVDGGSGVWSATGTNWANIGATSNGAYDPATMQIFVGAPGTVTVDAGGAEALGIGKGLQFANDGFVVQGDGLALTGGTTVVRVGDGTSGGAAMTATIASAVSGSGGLDKTDLGTLILTGTNIYAGGTTIAGGTLQLGNGGTTGSIAGNVTNNGVLAFNRSDMATFTGAISGSGTLAQVGTGTTILTAANTYTGSTTISNGALAIAATGGIMSDVTNNAAFQNAGKVAGSVINNAGATFTQTGGSVANGLTNAGAVYANGGALDGAIANNASGSFTVGGTVTSGGALASSGTFGNASGATLAVTAAGNYSISGLLTNRGAITVAAGGALSAAAGILNDTGGVITNDGTITDALDNAGLVTNNGIYNADVASNIGTINNNAGATWNGNFNTAGVVNNAGTINGGLTQNGGTTTNIGAITGTVTIAGGLFTGTGSIGGLSVAGGATIAPGAGGGIGTMSVAGGITFNAGSTYRVAVNAAGQTSRLNATGTALLNGGTVNVLAGAGDYRPQTDYTILSAAGGVIGSFANVTSNLAFLDPSLNYDASNVYLRLRRNDISFAGIGLSPNQIAVGAATEALGWDSPVFGAVVNLPAVQARDAFDQLSGDIHPSMRTLMLEDSRFVRNAVWDRLRASAGDDGRGVWGQAIGSWGHIGSDGNAARLDRSAGGLLMGIDTAATKDIRLGVDWGYSRTSVDARGAGKIDSYHLGAYAGGQWGAASIRAGIAYSWQDIHTTRVIAFPGFGDTVRASYNGGTFQAFGEFGYGFDLGRTKIEPYANVAYARARTDGFSEIGGDARLAGSKAATDVTFTTLGLRTATAFDLGSARATLRVGGGWRHAFGDAAPLAAMRYRAGGNAFSVTGSPLIGDAAQIDAGLDIAVSGSTSIGIFYGGQFGNRLSDQTARAGLTFRF